MNGWIDWLFQDKEWVPVGIGIVLLGMLGTLGHALWRRLTKSRPHLLNPSPDRAATASPNASPDLTQPSPAELRERYLKFMVDDCRNLPLGVVESDAPAPLSRHLTLDQVYIDLDTTTPRPPLLGSDTERSWDAPRLSAVEALCHAEQRLMVLLGQPGSGKSTFARYLGLVLAEVLLEPNGLDPTNPLPGWEGEARIPVFVSLRRLADDLEPTETGTADRIEDFIRQQVKDHDILLGFGETLLEELRDRGGVVIFDGLDEVDGSQREQIKQAINEFVALYTHCLVLVTCRVHSYQEDPGWQLEGAAVHVLAAFNDEKIRAFIDGWYQAQAALIPDNTDDYEDKRRSLKKALDSKDLRGLRSLAGTPLLLTALAIVHTRQALPGNRVEVYRECVDILLHHWQGVREEDTRHRPLLEALRPYRITSQRVSQGLRKLAFAAHSGTNQDNMGTLGQALMSTDFISGEMGRCLGSPKALGTFLDYCRHASGLLLTEGVIASEGNTSEPLYVFSHLNFEEYLAARYLGDLKRRKCIQEALERGGIPVWRAVVQLLGEYLCQDDEGRDIALAKTLLEKLCPAKTPTSDKDWRRAWMAGSLLPAFRRGALEEERDANLETLIVQRLVELLQTDAALADAPWDRAAVGRALARAGDPRPGVRLRSDGLPDLCWVRIPGTATVRESGRFPEFGGLKLGNGLKMDLGARDNEIWPRGAEPVEIADFELAVYPVTVAQFRPFVEQGGYAEENTDRYWSAAGWRARDLEGWKAPASWDDPAWTLANHPVIGVSWYEAEAYCNWLNERLPAEQTVRLPTEAEWEWAARGPEGRRYPWGDESPQGRCNFSGLGIGRTSAVGVFPLGAGDWWRNAWHSSEAMLHDLAGNVDEWTSSEYAKDYSGSVIPLGKTRSGSARGFRGGAWSNSAQLVRAAARFHGQPAGRDGILGFRLARTTR